MEEDLQLLHGSHIHKSQFSAWSAIDMIAQILQSTTGCNASQAKNCSIILMMSNQDDHLVTCHLSNDLSAPATEHDRNLNWFPQCQHSDFCRSREFACAKFFPSFACNLNRSGPARGLSASGLNAFLFKHSAMLIVGIEREASRVVEVEVRRIASTGGTQLVINTAPGAICTFLLRYFYHDAPSAQFCGNL